MFNIHLMLSESSKTSISPANIVTYCYLHMVLNTNGMFDDKYFVQVGGVAMGRKLGPSYACLFVGCQEDLVVVVVVVVVLQVVRPLVML